MLGGSHIEAVFPTIGLFLLACAVLCVAQVVYVLFGFGSGLIAVGVMALLVPQLTDVVIILLLVNLPVELFVVTKSRREITWRGIALICVGMAAGVPLGTWVLRFGEPTIVLTVLAGFLVVASLGFLLLNPNHRVHWPKWSGPPVGFVAGTLAGLFGTGGPPLVFYYQLAGVEKARFRGNLMAIFLVTALVRVPVCTVMGLFTTPRLLAAVALFPAALLGSWIGDKIHLEISEARFRTLVAIALGLIGLLLLSR